MMNTPENARPKTTIWMRGPDGETLVKTEAGSPYGETVNITVPGFGRAELTAKTFRGFGGNQTLIEARYTLK
jgi:hypothetical protein